jgi:DnaK suppressor protein
MMLTEEKKRYFRSLLMEQLEELSANVRTRLDNLAEVEEKSVDFVDQASLDSDLDSRLRFKERDSRLIAKINEALERLEEGTFGICESCGKPIAEERLRARPVALYCIACKRKQEAQERLRGL